MVDPKTGEAQKCLVRAKGRALGADGGPFPAWVHGQPGNPMIQPFLIALLLRVGFFLIVGTCA
jgi:hypothetical protein